MDFTDWYTKAETCVLVPRPRSYPKVMALVLPFTWQTWFAVAVAIAATYVFFFLASVSALRPLKYQHKKEKSFLVERDLFTLVPALSFAQSTDRLVKSESQAIRLGIVVDALYNIQYCVVV